MKPVSPPPLRAPAERLIFVLKNQPGASCQLQGSPWVANISYCSKFSLPSVADRPARKPTAIQCVSPALPGWGEQKFSNSNINQIVLSRMVCLRVYEVNVIGGSYVTRLFSRLGRFSLSPIPNLTSHIYNLQLSLCLQPQDLSLSKAAPPTFNGTAPCSMPFLLIPTFFSFGRSLKI
jgi:hypothetical protein